MYTESMPNLAKHTAPWQVQGHVMQRMQMTCSLASDVSGQIMHLLLVLSLHTQ